MFDEFLTMGKLSLYQRWKRWLKFFFWAASILDAVKKTSNVKNNLPQRTEHQICANEIHLSEHFWFLTPYRVQSYTTSTTSTVRNSNGSAEQPRCLHLLRQPAGQERSISPLPNTFWILRMKDTKRHFKKQTYFHCLWGYFHFRHFEHGREQSVLFLVILCSDCRGNLPDSSCNINPVLWIKVPQCNAQRVKM